MTILFAYFLNSTQFLMYTAPCFHILKMTYMVVVDR